MDQGKEIPMTKKQSDLIAKVYYKDGYVLGRQHLFDYLKTNYKNFPSERQVGRWLKDQKLNQLYEPTRKGGSVQSFKPTTPFNSMSADLIDFTNKPAQQYRYILVVIDNFSRFMFVQPLTSKTAKTTAKGMEMILNKLKREFNKVPRYILGDDGSEFKGAYIDLLKSYSPPIEKRRTLGGQPQSNGLVERANGKLKMIMAKNKEINKGTWKDNLQQAVEVYNTSLNRTIGMTPKKASTLSRQEAQILRDKVAETLKEENRERPTDYEIGDNVRIKIAKGKLDKSSTPNWSAAIYKIRNVIKGKSSKATRYLIEGKQNDQQYTRNDIQLIEGTPKDIPVKTKAQTRSTVKQADGPRQSQRLVTGLGKGGQPQNNK